MTILYAFISEEKHQELLSRYLNAFPGDFKEKILSYRRWQDAQLSLLGRVLLKHGLNTYYNINESDVELLPDNKPVLKGQKIHFNISHSKDLVVCIIADFPIGIDVEFLDADTNYLDFQFQMTAGEFDKIQNSEDKTKSLFTYWTQKEAVIKAHGSGMMIPLDSFEVSEGECMIDGEKFFVKDIFISEKYRGCIASNNAKMKDEVIVSEHFAI
ncbi:4'-phosphopantetheinyl transferase family protein [Chryseobacterium gossypii]|uniref:4'-phosphopantetheinyl transferase family protein n=1 Tax=Chryseobacterium gossypii TaxID=3231602 RepID=UPI003523BD9C